MKFGTDYFWNIFRLVLEKISMGFFLITFVKNIRLRSRRGLDYWCRITSRHLREGIWQVPVPGEGGQRTAVERFPLQRVQPNQLPRPRDRGGGLLPDRRESSRNSGRCFGEARNHRPTGNGRRHCWGNWGTLEGRPTRCLTREADLSDLTRLGASLNAPHTSGPLGPPAPRYLVRRR